MSPLLAFSPPLILFACASSWSVGCRGIIVLSLWTVALVIAVGVYIWRYAR